MSLRLRVAFDGTQLLRRAGGTTYTPMIAGYNVQEDSTPVDPADTSGGAGLFSFSFPSIDARTERALGRKTVDLEDYARGTTQGIARTPNSQGGVISMAVDSRLTLLAVERTAQPFTGTFGQYVTYLLGLVGITSGYQIDTDLAAQPVVFRGWTADVWVQMKKLLAGRRAEIALVSDSIVVRRVRQRTAVNFRDSSADWAVDDSGLALSVKGIAYPTQWVTKGLAYPKGGWNEDVTVFQVDSGEQLEPIELAIDASLTSVVQPKAVDYVTDTESKASVYCIMGADGLPLPAALWTANGGKVEVEIGEDTTTLIVKITGAKLDQYAPFRLAATSGPSNPYSSLRVLGTGAFFEREEYTFPTPVNTDHASQEVGAVLDSEFLPSYSALCDAIVWTSARFAAPRQTLTVTTVGIDRESDDGSYAYPTLVEVNTAFPAQTIGQVNTAYAGQTIGQVTEGWQDIVSAEFATQAFGNVGGARVLRDETYWRIRTVPSFGPSVLSYTAEYDTLVGDLDTAWAGASIAQTNTEWAGRTLGDLLAAPLSGADRWMGDIALRPYPDQFYPDTLNPV